MYRQVERDPPTRAPTIRAKALAKLADIYQGESDWLHALEIADQLCGKKGDTQTLYWRSLQAHFCCELTEIELNDGNFERS